jgi:regulatory protein
MLHRPRKIDEAPPDLRAGTITRLVAQKRDPDRVSVYVDDAFAFGCHSDVVMRRGLRKGVAVSIADQQAALDADASYRARAQAIGYLGSRPRTAREVMRRLGDAGFDESAAEQTVDWLREQGYVDDAAYAEQYAKSRMGLTGYGPQRVARELMQRGVERSLAEGAVQDAAPDEQVEGAALEQAQKRAASLMRSESDPRKRRKKLMDFLVRRGFDYETARNAAADALNALDDDSDF